MHVAVVTGGSSGIGQSAAIQLAQRGTGVIVTYGQHPDRAEETVRIIERAGGQAAALPLDFGDAPVFTGFREALRETLERTWQTTTFDYLVNNAGFGQMALFEDTTEALLDEFYRVLLKGPYFLTQALLPMMTPGGAIVNTSSSSALEGGTDAGYSAYASMKGAMIVLTRYWAKELSARGIRVNAVAPGPTRTRIGDDAFEKYPEVIADLAGRTALGRVGEPDDIGKVIAFLLATDGAWITGETIQVAGGYRL
jgi:NAD(P)-dependent dehydrogenase (short-subunit alcohol dehydrogenase family)